MDLRRSASVRYRHYRAGRRVSRTLLYGATVWVAFVTRRASEHLDDTAVALENVAGELAPYPVTTGSQQ